MAVVGLWLLVLGRLDDGRWVPRNGAGDKTQHPSPPWTGRGSRGGVMTTPLTNDDWTTDDGCRGTARAVVPSTRGRARAGGAQVEGACRGRWRWAGEGGARVGGGRA